MSNLLLTCDPISLNKHLFGIIHNERNGSLYSIGGALLDPEDYALPCGLVPAHHFNDSFKLNHISES